MEALLGVDMIIGVDVQPQLLGVPNLESEPGTRPSRREQGRAGVLCMLEILKGQGGAPRQPVPRCNMQGSKLAIVDEISTRRLQHTGR